ncbi:MAG: tRNA preQ1(34) S-adenosylmethionine ribosyltransferase-isomerase QueA [Parachlamydiales bacterium]|jgi:S-adenosylmethionine:tRNA ribosyltransferase-isomerase
MQGSISNEALLNTAAYDFELPEELVAQHPLPCREQARLLVVDRQTQTFTDTTISQLPQYIQSEDQLVFNDTKVIPARLRARRPSGAEIEILIHTPCGDGSWWALAKPARKLPLGQVAEIAPGFSFEVLEVGDAGQRRISFQTDIPLDDQLELYGEIPLPLYIKRKEENADKERYQTVFARHPGAVAAPTAGLHFTTPLLDEIKSKGTDCIHVTLHVGIGTFQPVAVEDIRQHVMHFETCSIDDESTLRLNARKTAGKRICVGTTSMRTLESMTMDCGTVKAGKEHTNLFIYPGYQFKAADALLTNFHWPKSTLLMLVSAFGGYDLIKKAYQHAVENKYRFYSYGDAMLII